MFENHRKSLIQDCERSKQRLHFEWTKIDKNAKNGQFGEFLKTKVCCQTVLPDRYILTGQKLVKNAKIENSNETF